MRLSVLLPFVEGELDSRSFAAAAQLAALHLSQDPFMYADWDVTFNLTYLELNDTKKDGGHSSPTRPSSQNSRAGAAALERSLAALRVGARLLRESDIGTDALIGGYSATHLEMQQLFQDPELQVRPARIHCYSTQSYALHVTQPTTTPV